MEVLTCTGTVMILPQMITAKQNKLFLSGMKSCMTVSRTGFVPGGSHLSQTTDQSSIRLLDRCLEEAMI